MFENVDANRVAAGADPDPSINKSSSHQTPSIYFPLVLQEAESIKKNSSSRSHAIVDDRSSLGTNQDYRLTNQAPSYALLCSHKRHTLSRG
jgi:hypothetical protein